MYNLGKRNLENDDLLSSGVNFYYSLYHSCLSVISSTSNKIKVENCVIEWEKREQLPRYYISLSHENTKKSISQFDEKLAYELDRLMEIREYLSYGPNVLYESGKKREISKITVYCCRFPDLRNKIRRSPSKLSKLINKCCKLLKENLSEPNFFFFMFYFFKTTDILCKNLDLGEPFISECKNILESFDRKGIKDLVAQTH